MEMLVMPVMCHRFTSTREWLSSDGCKRCRPVQTTPSHAHAGHVRRRL